MAWSTLALALFAQNAFAYPQGRGGGGNSNGADFLRFGCSQLVVDRVDPLVNPGQVPAAHMHQIVGGSSFNATMDIASTDPVKASKCTSCKIANDFSNYWTASIYFQSPENGTFKRVPQMANGRLNGTLLEQEGGLTVYYMRPFSGSNKKVTQMKPGFRMLAGDPTSRAKPADKNIKICHRCLGKADKTSGGSGAPCQGDAIGFPETACPGGIRFTVIFPSCWDGKNLDSPDHRSHVAYQSGAALAGDKCPDTHPVRIPQVMYEVMFDTSQFADPKYYKNGKQPLVYSFGDPTGYGAHGDYLFGWEGDALQKNMDGLANAAQCASETCNTAKYQPGKDAIGCTNKQISKESVGDDVWLKELPGNVQVQ